MQRSFSHFIASVLSSHVDYTQRRSFRLETAWGITIYLLDLLGGYPAFYFLFFLFITLHECTFGITFIQQKQYNECQ
jgi:hypothetical protein